jgi:hypothetical protein
MRRASGSNRRDIVVSVRLVRAVGKEVPVDPVFSRLALVIATASLAILAGCGTTSTGDGGTPADAGLDGGTDGGVLPKIAKLTRGPWMGAVNSEGVTVRWETDKTASPVVRYEGAGAGSATGETVMYTFKLGIDQKEVKRYQHSVALTGLNPGASYTYTLPDLKAPSGGAFATAPLSPAPFKFLVYGDGRASGPYMEDQPYHRAVEEAAARFAPDFQIDTGDMPFLGSMEDDWYLYFDTSSATMPNVPIFPTMGNHDWEGKERFSQLFPLPGDGPANLYYYSFDYSNAHIVVLCNYSGMTPDDQQMKWFRADLEANAKKPGIDHIFVSSHEPAVTYSTHTPDADTALYVIPLFKQYGGKLAFAGHNHIYEHIYLEDVNYLTLGGSGAPLYQERTGSHPGLLMAESAYSFAIVEVSGKSVAVKAYNSDGDLIDSFSY